MYELFGEAKGIQDQSKPAADGLSNFANIGLQVTDMLDRFGAKMVVDMERLGGQVNALLSKAVEDLQMFGQVLGNIGHALLNFASAMPGLAEVLLKIMTGFPG